MAVQDPDLRRHVRAGHPRGVGGGRGAARGRRPLRGDVRAGLDRDRGARVREPREGAVPARAALPRRLASSPRTPGSCCGWSDPRSLVVAGIVVVVAVAACAGRRATPAGGRRADRLRPAGAGPARGAARRRARRAAGAGERGARSTRRATRRAGLYDTLGAELAGLVQQRNYLGNGFVAGILYNLDIPPVPVPEGYSAARMAQIAERYRAAADRINATRDPAGLDRCERRDGALGVVQRPDRAARRARAGGPDPVHPPADAGPDAVAGSMLAQSVGGGTANMEFEALTGMSASAFPAQLRVPYQMVVPATRRSRRRSRWAKSTGHTAVGAAPVLHRDVPPPRRLPHVRLRRLPVRRHDARTDRGSGTTPTSPTRPRSTRSSARCAPSGRRCS